MAYGKTLETFGALPFPNIYFKNFKLVYNYALPLVK